MRLFLDRQYPGMYRDAKAVDLLRLALEQPMQPVALNKAKLIRQRDTLKVEAAKHYLERYIGTYPGTTEDIALKTGLHSHKLKKGFKEIYGTTIFGYLMNLRMEKAKSLLLNTDLAIQQVAFVVGYKHLANFTVAFKEHFGLPPKKARGRRTL